MKASYRSSSPPKYLYELMAEPDIVAHYICLAKFTEYQERHILLLLESIMCSIFGTYQDTLYKSFRSIDLPAIDWDKGANRSDPLHYLNRGLKKKRDRTLRNAREGGPMHVGVRVRTLSPTTGVMLSKGLKSRNGKRSSKKGKGYPKRGKETRSWRTK